MTSITRGDVLVAFGLATSRARTISLYADSKHRL
jgi:hypothetical protein